MDIIRAAEHFNIEGCPVSAVPISGGHINDTCRITASSGKRYILQRINTHVMKNPPLVMENIAAVTAHLRKKGMETLTIVPTLEGELCLKLGEDYYRMYLFIENARCYLSPDSAEDFRSAGEAFGGFIEALSDMPVGTVHIIPKASHDTVFHLSRLTRAVEADSLGRADKIKGDIEKAMTKKAYARIIQPLLTSGEIPIRIVHNDSKYSNIMIDCETHKARCILDLDNVMPGSLLCDYGDSIRSGCDIDGRFSAELAKAYTEGFLGAAASITKKELELLPLAPLVITYENAIRYLTDYLEGDVYFKTRYSGQNLDKFRKRMRLLADMEEKIKI
ncbi:MAG: phosphotransferase enzyme family protein [Clostridia bacterium]